MYMPTKTYLHTHGKYVHKHECTHICTHINTLNLVFKVAHIYEVWENKGIRRVRGRMADLGGFFRASGVAPVLCSLVISKADSGFCFFLMISGRVGEMAQQKESLLFPQKTPVQFAVHTQDLHKGPKLQIQGITCFLLNSVTTCDHMFIPKHYSHTHFK